MQVQSQTLTDDVLQPSQNHPGQISWAMLAELSDYLVELVKWEPGMVYPNHAHLDTEYIFVLNGDLADGGTKYGPKTLLTYPPGSAHRELRTENGVEFILIWTGKERITKT